MDNNYIVELEHITKTFGKFTANDDVTIRLKKGEIHALLGENGAGKSTLMNVLFGLVKPDRGSIKVRGEKVEIKNPNDATKYGIGMVHQHFKQIECFTVLQNIILGVESVKHGMIDMASAKEKVMALSEKYNFDINPDAKISDITVGMQQRVEILKMLYRENDILIFDEPTAVLTPSEIEELLRMMKELTANGKTILFITHKLNEIKAVADRCSVLRKGKYIDTFDVKDTTEEEMSEKMVGRKVNIIPDKSEFNPGKTILEVENLCVKSDASAKNAVNNVSFSIHAGEIVCIAGIDGNGQSELVYALTGLKDIKSGKITLNGEDITSLKTRKRTIKGIGHVPEDRLKYGLIETATVEENAILQTYYTEDIQSNGILKPQKIRKFTEDLVEKYDVALGEGVEVNGGNLSGGNQQKLVIAREMARKPDLFIASQPIRGLDVGAIEFIHDRLLEARDDGRAVMLVSFELSEVMNMSDRILVMYEGEIVADLNPKETTVKELGLYMAGAGKEKKNEKE